jgi:hypothetical protein
LNKKKKKNKKEQIKQAEAINKAEWNEKKQQPV